MAEAARGEPGPELASTPVWNSAALAFLTVPAVLTAAALGPGLHSDTSYAGASSTALAATAFAAALLGAAAAYTLARRTSGATAAVLAVAVAGWVGPVWSGWAGGPPPVRSLGDVVAPLLVPALVHLAVTGPAGRAGAPRARVGLRVLWVVAVAGAGLRAAVRDPVLDEGCWSNCSDASFLVHPVPSLAGALDVAGRWSVLALAAGIVVRASGRIVARVVRRVVRRGRPAARPLGAEPSLVRSAAGLVRCAAGLAVVVAGLRAAALLAGRPERPTARPFQAAFLALAVAVTLVGLAQLRLLLQRDAVSRALSRLVAELGAAPAPGAFEGWLGRALDDGSVTVLYRREEPAGVRASGGTPEAAPAGWVDTDGRAAEPSPGDGRDALVVRHRAAPAALVLHTRGRAGADLLRGRLGAAAGLVVGTERLRAVRLAALRDLQESRARLVEASDGARRRLERDLHDGAQQRLLAAGYRLRLAEAAGPGGGALADLAREVEDVTGELREIAHGIFSTAVDEARLATSLESLADAAPVPVEVDCPDLLVPPGVARAVHLLVEAATTAPADEDGPARCVEVVVRSLDGVLEVDVDGAGAVDWTSCADRFGALGGVLVAEPGRVHAEVPCG